MGGSWCKMGPGKAVKSHPRVLTVGVTGALMLFRDRVPVRDSCVLRSWGWGEETGHRADIYGVPQTTPITPTQGGNGGGRCG